MATTFEREIDQMYVWVPRVAIGTLIRHPTTLAVYLKLLSRARWESHSAFFRHIVDLQPGQALFGREDLAAECGTSTSKIRTAIRQLKALGYITVETTTAGTIATLVGYCSAERNEP
jgi:hypothetical protein